MLRANKQKLGLAPNGLKYKMKKNFLITTGGSGGHVIPATVLYEHLSNETNVIILYFVC